MQSICDEILLKLVLRKDKKRDLLIILIEFSDREIFILLKKSNKYIIIIEGINFKQKFYKQNDMLSSKLGKEDKYMVRKYVGLCNLKVGILKIEKMRF